MTLELVETVLAWAIGVMIFAAAVLTLVRITVGPSVLDRVVASDVLVSVVVCAFAAHMAITGESTTLPLLVSLALVGFLGSVAVARFVARDRDPKPDADGQHPEPEHHDKGDLTQRWTEGP